PRKGSIGEVEGGQGGDGAAPLGQLPHRAETTTARTREGRAVEVAEGVEGHATIREGSIAAVEGGEGRQASAPRRRGPAGPSQQQRGPQNQLPRIALVPHDDESFGRNDPRNTPRSGWEHAWPPGSGGESPPTGRPGSWRWRGRGPTRLISPLSTLRRLVA